MSRLEITRALPVPPGRGWQAFTDPAALNRWFWPHLEQTTELDLRVGGRYRFAGPKAGIAVAGGFVEVDPVRRLSFTWRWAGEEVTSLVTVELTPAGEGTVLSLVHEELPDEIARYEHAESWNHCLDRLAAWLSPAGGAPGPLEQDH
jgi:uncharacterized protein YndB with AHSA1/START domain